MAIVTNDFFLLTGLTPGPTPNPTPMFNIGLIPGVVIISALDAIAGRVIPVVQNPLTTFYYRKTVKAEDLTSLKLYIKGIF